MYKLPSRSKKHNRREAKPELVPVMDAMFIMIFFILSTSEFIKTSEIGSDLPIMKLSNDVNPEKKELILKLQILTTSVKLLNEATNKELFSSNWDNVAIYREINDKIKELKSTYPKENRVMVTADNDIKYDVLVKTLDAVRQTKSSNGEIVKLFNQIIFR